MDIRQVSSPTETRGFDTRQLREAYLIETLFRPGEICMTYSHLDRTVIGGATPLSEALPLVANKQIGSPRFLDRRELGIFNIGGSGRIVVDGTEHELKRTDALYVPMGTAEVAFISDDAADPARFYFISTPAHAAHPLKKITAEDANLINLGTQSDANVRQLRQYIHPDVCTSCQLVMGMTLIADGSVWNTMPCHTHDRRTEAYLYFDMAADTRVIHLMGEPQETRHLIVANEQAILSPGWSIHSGTGTGRYGFIWSMAGDNQDFNDMDFVKMQDLK
ncbi:5-dehydro-4-deoxy-D-glucuronate isomerase [Granulosicoccus antarcticus]|uniref:4-deoxy-L-threo-5-hexosulose-uronate ketol-isomerase n=1 Tax=Granulosicoccus antarcticus IMCC3135 TaxID=1192854 RepID=A0A2Z2NVS0_9GAMM|nr:5-dehydro-4-deoxy-D-glucuronate isomerase [Granulosicoccus antarcticus]ASJ74131.1 4-deoxy-L-threo-5-hexosulose-uronate ketol-isomerase 1 [Granulosicoccus antarcticus IMCC3135]